MEVGILQKQHERCKVVGQTNTCNRHEELRTLGIVPVTRNQQDGDDKFPFVVFSAPPSGSEDYVAEIRYVATKVEPCVQQVCGCSCTHGSLCFEMSYSEVACFVPKLHLHCWEVSTWQLRFVPNGFPLMPCWWVSCLMDSFSQLCKQLCSVVQGSCSKVEWWGLTIVDIK
jgi:hypothetical protein